MEWSQTTFEDALAATAGRVEERLERLLSADARAGEIARPERLMEAMRHGALGGGKRLRPFLVIESAALFGPDPASEEAVLDVAAALECVHCYSLVHDDLPAMDDDAMRRGRPTVHRAFDEATAILAGDALLTLAFDILAAAAPALGAGRAIALTGALARAAGAGGMVGGQTLDLAFEGGTASARDVETLQAMKTGALIRFACEAGALSRGAEDEDRKRLKHFGEIVGLAFQLADDLLDVSASGAELGKATGKDAARGKATLVALNGTQWAEARLAALVEEAAAVLAPFEDRAAPLLAAAHFIAHRRR